jgi:hypothetical protein
MPFNKSKESLKQTPQQQNPYIKIITQMKIQQQNQQKKNGRKKEETNQEEQAWRKKQQA